jgi:hypothetical protein
MHLTTNKVLKMSEELSYGFDFLKMLSQKIGDLTGFVLMCRELIQNADDEDCKWINFTFTSNSLVVENPSIFSEEDFAQIIKIGSEGKIDDVTKTGRFGVGFVSVYQICDQPVIISNGTKLIFDPANQKVLKDNGNKEDNGGTRVELKWARNQSSIREGLKQSLITDDNITKFEDDLKSSLVESLLFLKNIRKIRITTLNDISIEANKPDDEGHFRIIEISEPGLKKLESVWVVFEDENSEIIEIAKVKRSSSMGVAFPIMGENSDDLNGKVFCTLPTKTPTGLPIHVNADFAIKSDRTSILDEGDSPEVRWNKDLISKLGDLYVKAIKEAQDLVDDKVYATLLPPEKYSNPACEILNGIVDKFFETAKGETIIKVTEKNSSEDQAKWIMPNGARLLSSERNKELYLCLKELNAPLVVSDLQKRWTLLNGNLSVKTFSLEDLHTLLSYEKALLSLSDNQNIKYLKKVAPNNELWHFIESELDRKKGDAQKNLAAELPLCPCVNGDLLPFKDCISVEPDLLEAFPIFNKEYHITTSELLTTFSTIDKNLLNKCDLDLVIELLAEKTSEEIKNLENNGDIHLNLFYRCLDTRRILLDDKDLAQSLGNLCIYPGKKSKIYKKIDELFLPGKFEDPIGLDIVLDISKFIDTEIAALKKLGLKNLTVIEYLNRVAAPYFQNHTFFGKDDKRFDLLDIVRRHFFEIEEKDPDIIKIIKKERCIQCSDSRYRKPSEVNLDFEDLKEIFAEHPNPSEAYGNPKNESWRNLFIRLGLNLKPKINDVISKIQSIIALPFTESLPLIEQVFYYLAQQFSYLTVDERELLEKLRYIEWLPAASEEAYYLPSELYLWSSAKLVGKQGKLLRFSREAEFSGDFRTTIGLNARPSAKLIINNLRDKKDNEEIPDSYIYSDLNNRSKELTPQEIQYLSSEPLLYIDDKKVFVKGNKVFWGGHPFGKYRYTLPPEFRQYQKLMQDIMGVKNDVTDDCYLNVLIEIAQNDSFHQEFGDEDSRLLKQIYLYLSNRLKEESTDEIKTYWKEKIGIERVVLTQSKLLRSINASFFADKEWAVRVFKENLNKSLVDNDPNTWPFLNAIGVRLLSSVVKIENFTEPVDNESSPIQESISTKNRENAFKRIVETHKHNSSSQHWYLKSVLEMYITECTELEVEFSVEINGGKITSGIQHPDSHFDFDTSNLYIKKGLSNEIKLLEISRKIANILNPEMDPALLSSQIRYVIDPEKSDEEVHQLLTHMGLDTLDRETVFDDNWEKQPKGEADSIFGEENDSTAEGESDDENEEEYDSEHKDKTPKTGHHASPNKSKSTTPSAEDIYQKRLDLFNKKRKQSFQKRFDFEEKDSLPKEPKKGKPTPEEWEEHKHLAMVFYNRQIRNINREIEDIKTGIKSYDIYTEDWDEISKKTRERDGKICRRCGMSIEDLKEVGSYLVVHHIFPRKKGGSNWPSNLITLCVSCHREVENAPELL